MTQPCDCCGGPGGAVPSAATNRAGLDRIAARTGTHASILAAMVARLASHDHPALAGLTTREPDDPAIALLDAWATVGDVLGFYQDRLANDGYLRTATDPRALHGLMRLIGYEARPGVAAGVHLAFTVDAATGRATVPAGTRAQSVPAPGESMQSFETVEPLEARAAWNALRPRAAAPQTLAGIKASGLWLKGAALNLAAGDRLLIDAADGTPPALHRIDRVEVDAPGGRTRVVVSPILGTSGAVHYAAPMFIAGDGGFPAYPAGAVAATPAAASAAAAAADDDDDDDDDDGDDDTSDAWSVATLVTTLDKAPARAPAAAADLSRSLKAALQRDADTLPRLVGAVRPRVRADLYRAWGSTPLVEPPPLRVYALRLSAFPFGHNAPLEQKSYSHSTGRYSYGEWRMDRPLGETTTPSTGTHHTQTALFLDGDHGIAADSFVVVEREGEAPRVFRLDGTAASVARRSLAAYGMSGKATLLTLPAGSSWLTMPNGDVGVLLLDQARNARVHTRSEELELADAPLTADIAGAGIELDGLYDGLDAGRWLILSGERADIPGPDGTPVRGVYAAELSMLAGVTHGLHAADGATLPGGRVHTTLTLAAAPAYRYRRDTLVVHGNVARATHGEARAEALGGGDATRAFQSFTLKQPPLTHVAAPTPAGTASTLELRVNGVLWHEAAGLAELGPTDRGYVTGTAEDGRTSVTFGNGVTGARLPTGAETVTAAYRNGIGRAGNVAAGQITLLASRPAGLRGVENPLRASGGADRETPAQARATAPLSVTTLDRLVSLTDYADAARTFAGVGKAVAARLTDGRRRFVQVTVAGLDDIPIDPGSELLENLRRALRRYGDPFLPVEVDARERLTLVLAARVRVAPDHRWALVEPQVRAALLAALGFDRLELGQGVPLAAVHRAIHAVPGVDHVDVDAFDALTEDRILAGFAHADRLTVGLRDRIAVEPARVDGTGTVRPARIACLRPEVPDTLILQELTP